MDVNCRGCAGCCLDWRPLAPDAAHHERRGPRPPIDDVYNLVPLTREEVRGFVEAGLGDALIPRLWVAGEGDEAVAVGGHDLAAVDGRPVFFVGLHKPPKAVAPFGGRRTWLQTCAFLDPETLQCRIHGDDAYPGECADYPGHNLALGVEAECERVEDAFGGARLLDAEPPEDQDGMLLGPQALGAKLFAHPDPEGLDGAVARLAAGESTPADRAGFVGVAAASSPGTTAVDAERAATVRERVLAADSWVGRSIAAWERRAGAVGEPAPDGDGLGAEIEGDRGAPATPGWK
ncbi:MAG: YkgJ family cysteine cluster protein [Haloferacaceae archaeon]